MARYHRATRDEQFLQLKVAKGNRMCAWVTFMVLMAVVVPMIVMFIENTKEIQGFSDGTLGEELDCTVHKTKLSREIWLLVTLTIHGHSTPSTHWARARLRWENMDISKSHLLANTMVGTTQRCIIRYADRYVELKEEHTLYELYDFRSFLICMGFLAIFACPIMAILVYEKHHQVRVCIERIEQSKRKRDE